MNQNCNCETPVKTATLPVLGINLCGMSLEVDASSIANDRPGSLPDYSYEEKWTGRLWVDGRKIYQKTVLIDKELPKDVEVTVQHGIGNVSFVVSICGIFEETSGSDQQARSWYHMPHIAVGGLNWTGTSAIALYVSQQDISMKAFASRRPGSSFITLQYTCSDR